ncbi:(2Fe-2S)-binding protein [Paraburkholderia caribensis]|uniref:(2Fe-2S)-binding protein n=1 Tax=Paraburkholderia caribensis TaxID=75105 RepID=UPI000722F72A|nr:(2Fe-2S)-binding protein [Paraburkholderia caribensis]ALP68183.1 NAD(FAD)-dependent dehydrogenase [Paraburkholderia caribensis]AUT56400.1 NAD(FAD)-dependent dehydrogenase [Paraburkholderia caribensis]
MASCSPAHMSRSHSQLLRVAEAERAPVSFFLDGVEAGALTGDTVLTAILMQQRHVRHSEFSGEPRAGFCMIGACQDCWVRCEDGARIRACSTPVKEGMRIVTKGAP